MMDFSNGRVLRQQETVAFTQFGDVAHQQETANDNRTRFGVMDQRDTTAEQA